jgi:endonuclease/exonuclease/phosphatase family metal-dependent hydrolase
MVWYLLVILSGAAMVAVLALLLRDIFAFSNQFFPHPLALLQSYRFSPADLATEPSSKDVQPQIQPLTTIDVLSYNVNNEAAHHPTRRRRILRAIFSSGAQIILLQETNPSWEELLREDAVALEYTYTYFHHPGPSDRKAGGSAILSQFPLDVGKIQMFDFSNKVSGSVFPSLVCDVSVPRQSAKGLNATAAKSVTKSIDDDIMVTITIANIHLRPPVNLDGSAWLDTARKTEPIRIAEVKELLRRSQELSEKKIDIIAGDFNEGDNGEAMRHLIKEGGYFNALSQHVPRRKETHRWNYFGRVWQLRKRLDHILWSNNKALSFTRVRGHAVEEDECRLILDCIKCGVLTGYEHDASDHQPVLARFVLSNILSVN